MEPPRIILAIETSQREGSVALRDELGLIRAESLRSFRRHEDDLLPAIDRVVKASGMLHTDLDAVAVSVGPGGFTGLRIAIAAAKMLAEVLEVKLAAVPSALVAAASTPALASPALITLASKGERAWCTIAESCRESGWRIVGTPGLHNACEVGWSHVRAVVCDRFAPAGFRRHTESVGLPVREPRFDAAACLDLGSRMLARGEATSPLDLLPIYARPPEAVALWQARRRASPASNHPG